MFVFLSAYAFNLIILKAYRLLIYGIHIFYMLVSTTTITTTTATKFMCWETGKNYPTCIYTYICQISLHYDSLQRLNVFILYADL